MTARGRSGRSCPVPKQAQHDHLAYHCQEPLSSSISQQLRGCQEANERHQPPMSSVPSWLLQSSMNDFSAYSFYSTFQRTPVCLGGRWYCNVVDYQVSLSDRFDVILHLPLFNCMSSGKICIPAKPQFPSL